MSSHGTSSITFQLNKIITTHTNICNKNIVKEIEYILQKNTDLDSNSPSIINTNVSVKKNPPDIWWSNKMKLPIGKTGLYKCKTCRLAYSSQINLDKHAPKCKHPKIWNTIWIEDSMENRQQWRRS